MRAKIPSVPSTDAVRRQDAALVLQAPESELRDAMMTGSSDFTNSRSRGAASSDAAKIWREAERKRADFAEQMARSLGRSAVPDQHGVPGQQMVSDQQIPLCDQEMEGISQ